MKRRTLKRLLVRAVKQEAKALRAEGFNPIVRRAGAQMSVIHGGPDGEGGRSTHEVAVNLRTLEYSSGQWGYCEGQSFSSGNTWKIHGFSRRETRERRRKGYIAPGGIVLDLREPDYFGFRR